MTEAYAQKYQAARFDPDDPDEALAERARKAVLTAYGNAIIAADDKAPRSLEYLVGGLLVGVVQIVQASADGPPDEVDAAARASIIQSAGWAVDCARAFVGRDPLSDQS